MTDDPTPTGGAGGRRHKALVLSAVVDRAVFQAELDELRVREKAHTREGDEIAAARRRLPMAEVDGNLELVGPQSPLTLLEAFEGRRQLIAYNHGAALRLVSPAQYGYVSTKHLCSIEAYADRPPPASIPMSSIASPNARPSRSLAPRCGRRNAMAHSRDGWCGRSIGCSRLRCSGSAPATKSMPT